MTLVLAMQKKKSNNPDFQYTNISIDLAVLLDNNSKGVDSLGLVVIDSQLVY